MTYTLFYGIIVMLLKKKQQSRCGGTADALVSGSSVERRVGSNPVIRTNKMSTALVVVLVLFSDGI